MRAIKFRAWDGEGMHHDVAVLASFPLMILQNYPLAGFRAKEVESIMQFTGLRDKNIREIYEGDIVRLLDWQEGCFGFPARFLGDIQVVEWDKGTCGFSPYSVYDCDCGVFYESGETEVIGNIHENPELITKGKSE